MIYKVTKQFGASSSATHCGNFKTLEEARAYVQTKLAEDASLKIKNVIYKVLEGMDEVESYDSNQAIEAQTQAGGQSRSSSVTFSPTPFNAAPRPAGIPHNWVKDKEDDKKK